MLCDRVLGRWDDARSAPDSDVGGDINTDADAARLDFVDLRWDECHRRAHAKVTRGGRRVRLLLRLGTTLRHGDVLADAPDLLLVVAVVPCEVLVVRFRSPQEAALAALELGNLHAPVELTNDLLATPADGPAVGVLAKHGIPYTVEQRRFAPPAVSGVTWTVNPDGNVTAAAPAKAAPAKAAPAKAVPPAPVPTLTTRST